MNGDAYRAWRVPPPPDVEWRASDAPPTRKGVRATLASLVGRSRRNGRD